MSTEASSTPEGKPLSSATALWGQTLRIGCAHALLLFGYAGWLFVPLALHILIRVTFGDSAMGTAVDTGVTLLAVALSAWCFAALALAGRALHAQPDKPHDAEHAATQTGRIGRLLVTMSLAGIATVLGLVLIVPALVFGVWFAFAGLVTVFDGTWGFRALAASRELSRGRFMPVLWRLVACDVLVAVLLGVTVLVACAAASIDPSALNLGSPLPLPVDIALAIAQILVLPFIVLYQVMLYQELKKA